MLQIVSGSTQTSYKGCVPCSGLAPLDDNTRDTALCGRHTSPLPEW